MVEYADFHAVVATVSPVLVLAAVLIAGSPTPGQPKWMDIADIFLFTIAFVIGLFSFAPSLLVLGEFMLSTPAERNWLISGLIILFMAAFVGQLAHTLHSQKPGALPPSSAAPSGPGPTTPGSAPPPSTPSAPPTGTGMARIAVPLAFCAGWLLAHSYDKRSASSFE